MPKDNEGHYFETPEIGNIQERVKRMKHTPGKWEVIEDKTKNMIAEDRFIIKCNTNVPGIAGGLIDTTVVLNPVANYTLIKLVKLDDAGKAIWNLLRARIRQRPGHDRRGRGCRLPAHPTSAATWR